MKEDDLIFDPAHLVPAFVRRHLYIGDGFESLQKRYAAGVEEVWRAAEPESALSQFPNGYFDQVLIASVPAGSEQLEKWLLAVVSLLDENGNLTLIFPDGISKKAAILMLDPVLRLAGLGLYGWLSGAEESIGQLQPAAAIMVHADYNPVSHAQKVATAGRSDLAIQILAQIPLDLIADENMLAAIAAQKQLYYLQWQKRCCDDPPHSWFSKAQREFAQATAVSPDYALPYRTQADYWRHMGDDRTADSVRRTYRQSQQLEFPSGKPTIPDDSFTVHESAVRVEIGNPDSNPRILILGHSSSDYGMDTLYDGLCRELGPEKVVEYPTKPMLHGLNYDAAHNYPCTFSYSPGPTNPADILTRLQADWFDIILYADVVEMKHSEEIRLFLKASRDLPLVVYDTWDDCYTPMKTILEYLDRPAVDLIFKREMLAKVDYGSNTIPLPFSYPASLVKAVPAYQDRTFDFFWAGKREFGLRPIVLRHIEKVLIRKFDQTYDKESYIERIRKSRIGLSLWGYGFDTVRFWEIPAHGGLLLSQNLPIRVPHNFSDGQNAIFFDDLQELEEKLTYYLEHPEAAAAIASAGHLHWKTFHTTEARARQMLHQIETQCG